MRRAPTIVSVANHLSRQGGRKETARQEAARGRMMRHLIYTAR